MSDSPSSQWIPLTKDIYNPVAVSPEPGLTVVLARNAAGAIVYATFDGTSWQPWESLGQPAVRDNETWVHLPIDWPIAAAQSAEGQTDLVAKSAEGELMHARGALAELNTFELLGAPASYQGRIAVPMGITSPPTVCSRQEQHIDVMAVGLNGDLLYTRFDGNDWTPFESLGMPSRMVKGIPTPLPVTGCVSACAIDHNQFGIFFRGSLGDLMIKWWDGNAWSEFISLGSPKVQNELYPAVTVPSPLTGAPSAVSTHSKRMDVFARGAQGDIVHTWWDGDEWHAFESLWMPVIQEPEPACLPFTGEVRACATRHDQIFLFARALDGNVYLREYTIEKP